MLSTAVINFSATARSTSLDLLKLFHHTNDVESYTAGQTIFSIGEPGGVMYILLKGEVEISLHAQIVETIAAGGILGELALVDHSPRSATAVAKSDCVLARINEKRFLFLVQETPYFALHVMSVMAERLRRRTLEAVA
jgi:CRP/FNR family transcriptional regulator, cyclic AMP receptor protein